MSEQNKPQAGEWWEHPRTGIRLFAIGRDPSGTLWAWFREAKSPVAVTDQFDDWKHLPDCTGFGWVPEDPATTTIDVNPGEGYRWLGPHEIVWPTDEVFRPDCEPMWVKPRTRAGVRVDHFDPDDYPVRRKIERTAPPCPDCGEPLTDGHAEVCPEAWVEIADPEHVPRPGIDSFAHPCGGWIVQQPGMSDRTVGEHFALNGMPHRCRRKDLPPLPEPENPIPTPCNLGPGFSEPVDQVRVRLWWGDDCRVYATRDGEPLSESDEEITVDSQGQFWMRRTGK